MKAPTHVLAALLAGAILCLAPLEGGARQPSPDAAWSVEYRVSGGLAGYVYSVKLDHGGALEATDSRLRYHVRGRAPEALMSRVREALRSASRTSRQPGGPDMIHDELVLTTGGVAVPIADTGRIVEQLKAAFDEAIEQSVRGTWRQSGWKPCAPVAQLGRFDIDPPIETLELGAGGAMSVTWTPGLRPGHPPPHYAGTWRVEPRTGAMHIVPVPGIQVPPDVDGDGSFAIDQDTLTLSGVWFGTQQPPRRTDICVLMFTRK